jgi:hypothetical protein
MKIINEDYGWMKTKNEQSILSSNWRKNDRKEMDIWFLEKGKNRDNWKIKTEESINNNYENYKWRLWVNEN